MQYKDKKNDERTQVNKIIATQTSLRQKKKNIQQWTTKSKRNVMDNAEEPSLNRLQIIQT